MRHLARAMAFLGTILISILFVNATHGEAQSQPESALSFETTSIKPAPQCDGSRPANMGPGMMTLPCAKLRGLIHAAYSDYIKGGRINPQRIDVIGGPRWIDTDTFYVNAKTGVKASIEQMYGPMLRALLEERFHLKVHKEFRDKPVYELTVIKRNPNLKPTKEGSCIEKDPNDFSIRLKPEEFGKTCGASTGAKSTSQATNPNVPMISSDWHGLSMAGLLGILASQVDRPIIDKTGLTGMFDFHLEYIPSRFSGPARLNGAVMPPDASKSPDDAEGLSIFTALKEQLGLKLTPANGSVEVLVIDAVEKPSSD
jgi:uncharacterized protein (TIGR03435 family)